MNLIQQCLRNLWLPLFAGTVCVGRLSRLTLAPVWKMVVNQIQSSIIDLASSSRRKVFMNSPNPEPAINDEGLDLLRLRELVVSLPHKKKQELLVIIREFEKSKDIDSENGGNYAEPLLLQGQFWPSVKSCKTLPKLETNSSTSVLELRVDGRLMELDPEPAVNDEGLDLLRLRELLISLPKKKKQELLVFIREFEKSKDIDSKNGVNYEEPLLLQGQFWPSVKSCTTLPKLETNSSTSVLDLRVDGRLMELDSGDRSTTHDRPGLLESERLKSTAAAQRYEQEPERYMAEAEMESEMLARKQQQLWQDELLARRIENLTEDADSTQRPGSSNENQMYDLFFAEARDDQTQYIGVGCVLKDAEGYQVFQNRECLGIKISHHCAEYTALINGLAYARSLGVKRINAYGNPAFVYWEIQGLADREVWTSEQLRLMTALQEQVKELSSFEVACVSKAENEEAINLAKYAISLHVAEVNKNSATKAVKGKSRLEEEETTKECLICLEKIFASDMVTQKACNHEFCFNCLSQHIENETLAGNVPVRCPQFFACATHMDLYDCQHLISPKAFDIYATRLTEATILDSEKVYCPYPNCSAMMCRQTSTSSERSYTGGAECMECHRLFCVDCQVPWHGNLTCQQYQRLPPDERDAEFIKLRQLAKDQNWKRCKLCRRMISLSHGCSHMTCRCGYQFCYTCETQYENKKKMCKCPLFPITAVTI